MDSPLVSRLEPEALNRVLEALRTVGVAGNEGDRRFDEQDLKVDRPELEQRLRHTGNILGTLTVETLAHPRNGVDVLIYDTGRHQTAPEAELAWDQEYQSRWQDIVKHSVQDWLDRLDRLRSQISDWIRDTPELSNLTLVDLAPANMFEEMMKRFNVPPAKMPVFDLRRGSERVLRFQPKGLWIIGANGRVDLITKSSAPILVDLSERFTRPSDWKLHYSRGREKSATFTLESFKDLVCSESK